MLWRTGNSLKRCGLYLSDSQYTIRLQAPFAARDSGIKFKISAPQVIANCAHWLMDTAPLTRYYGRSTFALLGTVQPLDKLVSFAI